MHIDIEQETLITLADAAKRFPQKLNICTLFRWCKDGVRNTVLESVVIGGRRWTSVEAIRRFVASTSRHQQTPRSAACDAAQHRDNDAARRLSAKGV